MARNVFPYESLPVNGDEPQPKWFFAIASWGCVSVPFLSWAAESGPMFLLGSPAFAILGFVLGCISMSGSAAVQVVGGLAIGVNALTVMYFFWLIFVHGLC